MKAPRERRLAAEVAGEMAERTCVSAAAVAARGPELRDAAPAARGRATPNMAEAR